MKFAADASVDERVAVMIEETLDRASANEIASYVAFASPDGMRILVATDRGLATVVVTGGGFTPTARNVATTFQAWDQVSARVTFSVQSLSIGRG